MRLAKHDGAFTEILVQRDKDPPFVMGESQDFLITRITRPVSGSEHIMSAVPQPLLRPAPDTSIKQQPHVESRHLRFDSLVADESVRISEAGQHIFALEPGITF